MALIKTINEVKLLMPRLLSALSNNALMPNLDEATEKYLVPVIGVELFNQVHEKYTTGAAMTAQEAALLPKMQLVVAAHAFLDELAFSTGSITDHGMRSATTVNQPRVYGWEFKEFKNGLSNKAMDSVDTLLQYLFKNKEHFAAWTGSEAFKQFDAFLIKTAIEFDAIHKLHQPFRTFYALKTVMADVQEQFIYPSIGMDIFNRFNTATDLTEMEKLAKRLVQKAIAFLTIKRACEHYAVRMDPNGFSIVSLDGDPDGDSAGRSGGVGSLLSLKMASCEREGNNFLAKARNWIADIAKNENAPEAFKTAFATSPLVSYIQPKDRDHGNGRRKIFRA